MHGAYNGPAKEWQALTCPPLPHHISSFAGVALRERVNLNLAQALEI